MSTREIPLTSGSDTKEDKMRNILKTPFPRSPSQNDTSSSDQMTKSRLSDTPPSNSSRLPKSSPASTTINLLPSQAIPQEIKGDPACPLKYYRPHTVGNYRSSTELLNVRDNWTKSSASQRFHHQYPEPTPDLRRKPDLRLTTNEKRHVIPEAKAHTYLFRGADHF